LRPAIQKPHATFLACFDAALLGAHQTFNVFCALDDLAVDFAVFSTAFSLWPFDLD